MPAHRPPRRRRQVGNYAFREWVTVNLCSKFNLACASCAPVSSKFLTTANLPDNPVARSMSNAATTIVFFGGPLVHDHRLAGRVQALPRVIKARCAQRDRTLCESHMTSLLRSESRRPHVRRSCSSLRNEIIERKHLTLEITLKYVRGPCAWV
jgi:hypothetical protein